jgi:predicted DNA-binding antitoxin AbrB/MazE fold protein
VTVMSIRIEAIYENGMLRPLEPLDLREHQRVTVIVEPALSEDVLIDTEYMQACKDEADYSISIDEVRRALSGIKGSLTADFIKEREGS